MQVKCVACQGSIDQSISIESAIPEAGWRHLARLCLPCLRDALAIGIPKFLVAVLKNKRGPKLGHLHNQGQSFQRQAIMHSELSRSVLLRIEHKGYPFCHGMELHGFAKQVHAEIAVFRRRRRELGLKGRACWVVSHNVSNVWSHYHWLVSWYDDIPNLTAHTTVPPFMQYHAQFKHKVMSLPLKMRLQMYKRQKSEEEDREILKRAHARKNRRRKSKCQQSIR